VLFRYTSRIKPDPQLDGILLHKGVEGKETSHADGYCPSSKFRLGSEGKHFEAILEKKKKTRSLTSSQRNPTGGKKKET